MTKAQRDMLETMKEHESLSAVSYRLTFTPEEQKWARDKGFIERKRSKYQLTDAGLTALGQ